jgi:hypothetical protein
VALYRFLFGCDLGNVFQDFGLTGSLLFSPKDSGHHAIFVSVREFFSESFASDIKNIGGACPGFSRVTERILLRSFYLAPVPQDLEMPSILVVCSHPNKIQTPHFSLHKKHSPRPLA